MSQYDETEYLSKSFDISVWKKIFKLISPLKNFLILLLGANIIYAFVDAIFPYLNKYAIDTFTSNDASTNALIAFSLGYVGLIIFQALDLYVFFYASGKIEMKFAKLLRSKCFRKLNELSFSYFDKTPQGWIIARLTSDVTRLSEIMAWSFLEIFYIFGFIIFVSVIMFSVNVKLALLVVMIIPFLAYASYFFQSRILKSYREVRKNNSKITAAFSEGIMGAKTTKTLSLEERNLTDFKEKTMNMKVSSIKAATLSAVFVPVVVGLGAISNGAILWIGGNEVQLGLIEIGTLYMFTQYAKQFIDPLRHLAGLIGEMQMAQASAERVISLLEQQPDIVDNEEVIEKYGTILNPKKENYERINGDVEFKNVEFYYNKNEPILKNFNLKVNAGETIALVGETGSGKSTIINLICRFYEPISGELLIDGQDYRKRSVGWLHSQIGYVLQAPHLFSGTIKENVKFGKYDATDEEIIEACKTVSAHDFIMELENGYDTIVGESGSKLSTGQKQLISFARAVLINPAYFVLDEATASIDTETEKILQDTIETTMKGKTSFVVAHRLSTIVNADRILVIKKGEIVEDGTHKELLNQRGYYYNLYTNQFKESLEKTLLQRQG